MTVNKVQPQYISDEIARDNEVPAFARATVLTGLSLATGGTISAANTMLEAFGKLQYQITNFSYNIDGGTPSSTFVVGASINGGTP